MKTEITADLLATAEGQRADSILRSCVHCGFCTATCPTYQLLGDELDGPRGRIYQIKVLLEGKADDRPAMRDIQQHLDRCLTCRSCETTCPSGVQYGRLLEIGRGIIHRRIGRPLWQRLYRKALLSVITHPQLTRLLFSLAQPFRPLMPQILRKSIPARHPHPPLRASAHTAAHTRIKPKPKPKPKSRRRVLLLDGCIQSAVTPQTNQAAAQILLDLGIEVVRQPQAGCCGAAELHTDSHHAALQRMRKNCDQWLKLLDNSASGDDGVEAIISTASGCGVTIKDYADLLKDDSNYSIKAQRISEATQDIAEFLIQEDLDTLSPQLAGKLTVAYHPPCTLQHGQALPSVVEKILDRLGFERSPVNNAHLCCGSAGTYSIFQPEISSQLLDNKLDALQQPLAECIATSNIGCQLHLASKSQLPVIHWLELLTRESIERT